MAEEAKEPIGVLNKYLKQVPKEGIILFRGHADDTWFLEPGATRRLKKHGHCFSEYPEILDSDKKIFIEYHVDLIRRAHENRYHQRKSTQQTDLELLADLQHFGAATCFIDFTRNFLVALWFACRDETKNGKVFCIDISNDEKIQVISEFDNEKNIENILTLNTHNEKIELGGEANYANTHNISWLSYKYNLWWWEPPGLSSRILQQDSVFVFGQPVLLPQNTLKEITIKKEDKAKLGQLLKEMFNISTETLFKDFEGFANVNRIDEPIPTFNKIRAVFEFNMDGISSFGDKNYKDAINYFNRVITIDNNDASAYYNRAKAKHFKGDQVGALKDFTHSIKLFKSNYLAYYDRSIIYGELERYDAAIKDLHIVIKLNPTHANAFYSLGIYYELMKKFKLALKNFEIAKKIYSKENQKKWGEKSFQHIELIKKKMEDNQ